MTNEARSYVEPEMSDARVNRLWGNVSARLAARRGRAWRWLALAAALTGTAAVGIFAVKPLVLPAGAGAEGAVMAEAKLQTASDALDVTLVDGSRVSLASRTEVQVRGNRPNAVSLSLTRGQVVCDVTHHPERAFTVVAGDVQVRVVGTKFSVRTSAGEDPRVEVSVLRGVVEVVSRRRPGIVARVAAGQSWIQNPEPRATEPNVATPQAAAPQAVVSVPAQPSADPPAARVDSLPDAKPAGSAPLSAPSARELFEKAGESRRVGDAAAAARAYEELLRLHPADGRASLAAFELGRLRMDRLGDPQGAVSALERAVALNIGPSFREDALARLVSVYASQGNFGACGRARDRYLASYPAGVHASAVASRCGAR